MHIYNIDKLKREGTFLIIIAIFFILLYKLGFHWFCPFFDGLGIPDPGCGYTSSLIAASKLDFVSAFYHHPLFWVAPLFFIFYLYANFTRPKLPRYYSTIIYIIIILFLITYILRMLHIFPYSAPLNFNDDALIRQIFKF